MRLVLQAWKFGHVECSGNGSPSYRPWNLQKDAIGSGPGISERVLRDIGPCSQEAGPPATSTREVVCNAY